MNTPGTTVSNKASVSHKVSLSQGQKTALFGAVALLSILIAVEPWRGHAPAESAPSGMGPLFPDFTKAAQATGIQITKFDEDTGKPHTFSVKLQGGRWIIPSHENYPADARQHMAEAAVSVLDLKSLGMVSDRPGDFRTFGVLAPDLSKLKPGDTGIGMQVIFRGANDSVLADLIIGKADKDQPDLRYVRRADRDQIYQAQLKTDKLSTNFADWIEKDLLKINAFDIREVQLNDYSLEEGIDANTGQPTLGMIRRSKMKLDYDDEKSKWNLVDMFEYKKRAEVSAKLGEDEELNTEKLNAMRTALDDLKIVDVQRKPAGLSRDLRVTEAFGQDREASISLQKRGFYPYLGDILSTEGEVLAFVKDGVGYTLRFGEQTLAGSDQKDDAKKSETGEEKSKGSRLNRYLFISCQFLENRIPKPQLRELPSESDERKQPSDETKKGENAPAGAAGPGGKPAETTPAPDKSPADKSSADKSPADKNPADKNPDAGDAAPGEKPAGKQGSISRPRNIFHLTADEKLAAQKPAADSPAAEEPAANPADAAPAEGEAKGGQILAKAREAKALADLRATIEKENKRQQTEYDEKITKGREHAQQLNDRFADWYYVISDEVYHKIHLSRADVIKKKEKTPGKGDGVGDLDALKNLGLPGHKHDDHDHK